MSVNPVVCNSSPLIGLNQIGQLTLFKNIFGSIIVPLAVVQEVTPDVILPDWIEQRRLSETIGPLIMSASLGAGESEAISLALEVSTRLIILDDRPARRLAQSLNIPVIGTLGILLAAKRQHYIPSIKPHLEALIDHDFRIAPMLYEKIIHDAGESL